VHALPDEFEADLLFAKNGIEAIEQLKTGRVRVLFLDLNMPVLDGFGVLKYIQENKVKVKVIVVSGDIQPEAHERVMGLGALAFIKKPVNNVDMSDIIRDYDLNSAELDSINTSEADPDLMDAYREITNVAMGQAADLLARVLGSFVVMPIPNVNIIEVSELQMAVTQATEQERSSAVCQGFIGGGLAGEAMLLFSDSSYQDIAEMTNFEGTLDDTAEIELLMDLTNILIGAILKGIAEQFDINISLSHPVVLGRHANSKDLVQKGNDNWKSTLAIDMQISIENKNVSVNLLLLFTEDSIPRFNQLISYVAA
jgi:chemotaxis protein CheY-P-specific phosphatase CheC